MTVWVALIAGAFSDPQHIGDDGFEWAAVEPGHRLRPSIFVAQVIGKSMEPAIPDGACCLLTVPVEGARQGHDGARATARRYRPQERRELHHQALREREGASGRLMALRDDYPEAGKSGVQAHPHRRRRGTGAGDRGVRRSARVRVMRAQASGSMASSQLAFDCGGSVAA